MTQTSHAVPQAMSLYALTDAQNQFIERGCVVDADTGEITWEEPAECALALAEKAEACAVARKSMAATVAALKAERDALTDRIKAAIKAAAKFDDYLIACANNAGGVIDTPKCRISTRRSQAVDIIDADALPREYTRSKTTIAPDKAAIKAAIKAGIDVPGAAIVENVNLSVK